MTDTAISTEVVEAEFSLDFSDSFDAADSILDDSHIVYADPDDDPLEDVSPGLKHINANASDGFFHDGDERIGNTLDCIILDYTQPRQLWKPKKASDPLYEELKDLTTVKGPLCRTNHHNKRSPEKSEPPRFHKDLTESDVETLKSLTAGDCNTCELTKRKACKGGRKLLVYSDKWEEPVAFQVGVTSIGTIEALWRTSFKHKGKSVDISLRPVRFGWKKEKNTDGEVYYELTAIAGKPRPAREVKAYQALREVYRLRRPGHEESTEYAELPAGELPLAKTEPEDPGRLI